MGGFLRPAVAFALYITGSPVIGAPPRHVELSQNQKFAACVVQRRRADSDALIRSEPGSDVEARLFSALAKAIKQCDEGGSNGLIPGRAMFRGMLAERLWLGSVSMFEPSADTPVDPNKIDFGKSFDGDPALLDNYHLSFCVAYTRPELIDRLLRTDEQSLEEIKSFDVLSADISRCLPAGHSVSLDRRWLRASLAEQLYRRYPPVSGFKSRSDALIKGK